MNLSTMRFGEIEIDQENVIVFEQGIPGFEDHTKFVILTPDEEIAVQFLQSINDGDLSFIVANPFDYFYDYDFELPDSVIKDLGIDESSQIMILSILTINEENQISINLMAPIVVNTSKRLAKQVILHNSPYKTKHDILLRTNEEQTNSSLQNVQQSSVEEGS